VYQRSRPAQGNDPALLQRVDPVFGQQLFPPVSVDNATGESLGSAELTVLSNGNVVVVWSSQELVTFTNRLWFSVFDPNGAHLTGKLQIGPTANNAFPVVEALRGGGFVAAWQKNRERLQILLYAK